MTSSRTLPSFVDWVAARDSSRTGDPLWSLQAYRLASYAIDCHNFDRRTNRKFSTATTVGQLTQAIGSIAANIAEGYSRATLPDQNRSYGYALGSAREAIEWYDSLRFELGALADERQATLIQVGGYSSQCSETPGPKTNSPPCRIRGAVVERKSLENSSLIADPASQFPFRSPPRVETRLPRSSSDLRPASNLAPPH